METQNNNSSTITVLVPIKKNLKPSEYILCAAIHFKNGAPATVDGIKTGVVVSGRRHGDCYDVLSNIYGKLSPEQLRELPDREDQGFLTSHNRYVSRTEAFKIAKANNQIWHNLFDGVEEGSLASEDLY